MLLHGGPAHRKMTGTMKAGHAPKARSRGVSVRLVVIATALALMLGGALVAAPFVIGRLVRERITREAADRGVEMTFSDVSFWWWMASLDGVRFRLTGVPGIDGTARNIDVTLSSWEPRRIGATDVRLEVVGSAADLALAVGEWAKNHPKAYEIPLTATHVAVSYRGAPSEAPWLTLSDGAFAQGAAGETRFGASHAMVSGVDVGAIAASWTATAATVSMAFGAPDMAHAPLTLLVNHSATPPSAVATLARTPLSELSGPLGIPLVAPGAVASGSAELTFVSGLPAGPVTGKLTAELSGWIPPHPAELDGFLFGSTTTFTSSFDVSADRTLVQLSQSRVRAGAFVLDGRGTIERHEGHATVHMELSGNLPCAAVAQSAAAAHVGTLLSRILGQAARRVVEGSVAVKVAISADSRNLGEAKIERSVGVGCGLVPLLGLDVGKLAALPKELQDIARSLPLPETSTGGSPSRLPSGLPSLPSSLPSLPSLASSLPSLPSSLPSLPSSLPFGLQAPH